MRAPLNLKTKMLWNISPQRKELILLNTKLEREGLTPTEMKRWGYLRGIQREMDKIRI